MNEKKGLMTRQKQSIERKQKRGTTFTVILFITFSTHSQDSSVIQDLNSNTIYNCKVETNIPSL